MSPDTDRAQALAARFPRVSGDEPVGVGDLIGAAQFSPREWG